jgi:Tex-like protein N-terminal domain
MPRHWL